MNHSANKLRKLSGPPASGIKRFSAVISFICLMLLFVLCPIGLSLADSPDAYEPDNIYTEAQLVLDPVTGVFNQRHTFHDFFDEDWLKFSGTKGKRYMMDAIYPDTECDPIIELYYSDGNSLLVKQNNFGPGERELLIWMCPEDGIYYVRLTNNTASFGSDVAYQLSLAMLFTGPSLPGYVTGRVTIGGVGLGGARFVSGEGVGLSQADGTYILSLSEGTSSISVRKDGYYPQSFTVNVAANQTIRRDVTLVKIPNPSRPPTISGTPDTSAYVYHLYSFIPSASDPDGDSFTFSIINKPDWASFNPDNGMLIGIPGTNDVGGYDSIIIQARDSQGQIASLPPFDLAVRSMGLPGIILLLNDDT